MLYLPIKRSKILSRWAQRAYFGCAMATFYLLAILIGAQTAMMVSSDARSPAA
jgi:hypothetical protein